LFTLGSDAHKASDYRLDFAVMSELLRSFGVNQLAVFQGSERFMADLPTE
jgi:histidinol-phosphatase (PHP family)